MKKLAIIMSLVLAGCGSFVPTTKVETITSQQTIAMNQLQIFNQAQLINKDFKVLDIIEGHSCKNKLWDEPATRTGAIEQIKYQAVKMNADGITNVQCGGKEGTSVSTNCWQLVSCTAEAIKLNK